MEDPDAVTDPTDFASTPLSSLSAVDALLRCQICKDLFNNAVITSCCHTFCSLCIRRSLSAEGKCPTCRTTELESRLRRNVAVQELVDSYSKARPEVLKFAQNATLDTSQNVTPTNSRSLKRKRSTNEEHPAAGRPSLPRTRSQHKISVDHPSQTPSNGTLIASPPTAQSADPHSLEHEDPTLQAPQNGPDSLVPCPICLTQMKPEAVFNHLDTCSGPKGSAKNPVPVNPDSSAATDSPSALPRLPQLNYSLLKENVLRKKLSELGIPSWGSKALMMKRHTEWINLWNANCDSSRPKSRKQLQMELENWERSQGGRAKQSDATIFGAAAASESTGNSTIMRKDFDGAAWAKQNKCDFDALISNARKGASKKAAQISDTEIPPQPTPSALEPPPVLESPQPSNGYEPFKRETQSQVQPTNAVEPVTMRAPHGIHTRRRRSSPVPGFSRILPEISAEYSGSAVQQSPVSSPGSRRVIRRGSGATSPVAPLTTESSLPDRIFKKQSSFSSDTSKSLSVDMPLDKDGGVKKMPMFKVPSEPVDDADVGGASR